MDRITRVSRRQALQLAGAAGVWSLAACSPSGPATPGATVATSVPTGPKVGGELRMDILSEPTSIDPLRFNGSDALRAYRLATSRLLTWDKDHKVIGDLAVGPPTVSADSLTYTFKLKPNVKWHDGKAFDAADVKFTYETVANPQVASIWRPALNFLESVETPDTSTVIFKMKSRFTLMLNKFALIPIISSKVPYVPNDTYARTIIGTGPYRVTEWQSGVQIVFERFPEYFDASKTYINKITQRVVKENAARVTNVINGQSQLITEAPAPEMKLMRDRGVTVSIAEGSTIRVVLYPALRPDSPTLNVNLRKAISWALDRKALVDQVYAGAAVPASTYLSSGSDYFDKTLGMFYGERPDLTKARAALQAAGGPPSRELVLVTSNVGDPIDIGQIVQANLKAIGINVRLSAEEGASYTNKILNNVDYDLCLVIAGTGASSGYGSDYVYNGMLSTSPNSFNRGGDPTMDQLLIKAISVPEAELPAAWKAVQEYDINNLYQIQLVTARYIEAYSKRLQGYYTSDLGTPYTLPFGYLEG